MPPFDLQTAVNRVTWAWFWELPHRLNVAVEIVDERYASMLPVGSGSTATILRRMLASTPAPLKAAISNALESKRPYGAFLGGHQCVCVALAQAGVLVLAREVGKGTEAAKRCRRELETIGAWLAAAVDAHLASPPQEIDEKQHRIDSLQRLLNEAVASGSVRDLVAAFAEALTVWDGIDVRGYVATAHDGFLQYVSCVGADPSAMPDELDAEAIPNTTALIRLADGEARRLGFGEVTDDLLIKRIATDERASWVIVFRGKVRADQEARLDFCSDLLREALNKWAETTKSRLSTRIPAHLFNEPLELTAQLALREVAATIDARQLALAVTAASGRSAISVGDTSVLPALEESAPADRLVVSADLAESGFMTLVAGRPSGGFTVHERHALEAAASILRPWARWVVERSGEGDRRSKRRSVHEVIDQLAARTAELGDEVAVLVFAFGSTVLRPGLMHAWVAAVRRQLRPWDLAAVLSGSEIVVLLRRAPADEVSLASARLLKLFESDESAGIPTRPSVGTSSYGPESPTDCSLVRLARDDAMRNRRVIDAIARPAFGDGARARAAGATSRARARFPSEDLD